LSWRSTRPAPASPCGAGRRRFVQQQQRRVGAQGARDLHQPLRAQRQVAGQLVHLLGHADALQLALGLGEQAALLGAVQPQHAPARRRAAQVAAQRHVLQHRHLGDHLHVLEGARHAAPRDLARRQPATASPRKRTSPPSAAARR
jgi:hypothetical protein